MPASRELWRNFESRWRDGEVSSEIPSQELSRFKAQTGSSKYNTLWEGQTTWAFSAKRIQTNILAHEFPMDQALTYGRWVV